MRRRFHERRRREDPSHIREGAFGHARALVCRECGHEVELGPHYACPECFGPLEVGYDARRVTREQIEAGPRNIWRYKALLPVPNDIEQSPNTEPGFTRLLRADNLGRELGIDNLWVKDDSTNPTNSFKDRVVACALSAARELGARSSPARPPATSPTRSPRQARGPASRPSSSSLPTSSGPRRSTPPSTPSRWSP